MFEGGAGAREALVAAVPALSREALAVAAPAPGRETPASTPAPGPRGARAHRSHRLDKGFVVEEAPEPGWRKGYTQPT